MAVLVWIEQKEGEVLKASRVALTAAHELVRVGRAAGPVLSVVLGKGARTAADRIAELSGGDVLWSEHPVFSPYRAVPYGALLSSLAGERDATAVVVPATSAGKDLSPRVAAALDAGQASDIVGITNDGAFIRPMYAGNIFATVEVVTPRVVVTVRPTGFPPLEGTGGAEGVIEIESARGDALAASAINGEVVGYDKPESSRPQLSDAAIVVSGGRALKSAENFQSVMGELADALGAAIGASRAAVDAGYAPNDWQVGQTGKVVAPSLYIGVGVSGAIQHLAGIKDSKVIVAINKDPEAPIFEVADYGLVADLFDAVPKLVAEIRRR